MNLRLLAAALDVSKFEKAPGQFEERLILRGVIDPLTLDALNVDTYQRETLSGQKMGALKKALAISVVPDIEVGMRGDRMRCQDGEKGTFILLDPVYIIDGLQRVSAARSLLIDNPKAAPRIGVTVHFDTEFQWEKERFRILNQERTKVSSNVLLRNAQSDYKAVDMLAKLCVDETFALANRIQWQQCRLRSEVISAMTFAKVAVLLHGSFGTGSVGFRGNYTEVSGTLEKMMEKVGRTTMRDNIKDFFNLIDECFGIRKIVFSNGAVQVKETFLLTFAEFFSDFSDFWKGSRFFVDRRLRLKIAKFPISDPEIYRLASSGGKAGSILYEVIVKEINRGKRSRRLISDEPELSEESAGILVGGR